MNTLWQDVRYSLRQFAKNPGFTGVAVLTLALGIGATAAIFSVVDGVLLRSPPLQNPERLVVVWETDRNSATTHEPASVPDFRDFRDQATELRELAAFLPRELNLTPQEGEPVRLTGLGVTHSLLPLLGIQPLLGRGFTAEEDQVGGPAAAMIGERMWERQFARDPGVVGRTIHLDDAPFTIVGVLPAAADFGTLQILGAADYGRAFADRGTAVGIDLWVPLAADPERLPRDTHPIFVLGRLAPGATVGSAQQEMRAIAAELEAAYPENEARGVRVEPLNEVVFGPVRPALLVLLGAVGLVLLIGCANVANLLLVRALSRSREVAVRSALGAGAGRLARQFLVENLTLTLVAAAAGAGLAWLTLDVLLALAPPDIARISDVTIDGRVLGFTGLTAVVIGTLFGLLPVLQARRVDLQAALKGESGRGATGGPDQNRLRSALVVAEVGLAVVLLVGAGLLIKSFWNLSRVDPGFRTEGILNAEFTLPASRYPADFSAWPNLREMHRFNDALLGEVQTLPGVRAAAIAGNHPMDAGFTNSFTVVGREAESAAWPEISIRRVTPDYFRVTGLSLRQGRLLGTGDGTDAAPVLLINETAERQFFAGRDPLGQQIAFWGTARTVVGVVADESSHGLAAAAPPAAYAPLAQAPSLDGGEALLLRVDGDPLAVAPAVRSAIRDLDPGLAVFGVEPLAQTVSRSIGQQRFTMLLLGLFAGIALLLALVGVYGVLSYSVAHRTREIGIRAALGAPGSQLIRLFVRHGMLLALGGVGIGLAGAWGLTRVLASILYGVSTTDTAVFIAVPSALLLASLLATWLPARRATRVDPVAALRAE